MLPFAAPVTDGAADGVDDSCREQRQEQPHYPLHHQVLADGVVADGAELVPAAVAERHGGGIALAPVRLAGEGRLGDLAGIRHKLETIVAAHDLGVVAVLVVGPLDGSSLEHGRLIGMTPVGMQRVVVIHGRLIDRILDRCKQERADEDRHKNQLAHLLPHSLLGDCELCYFTIKLKIIQIQQYCYCLHNKHLKHKIQTMKITKLFLSFVVVISLPLCWVAIASATNPPDLEAPIGLSFAEIGITGSNEFVLIQNNTPTQIDLSTYWLYQYNNYDPSLAGTTTSTQQLPAAQLDAGQSLMLNKSGQNTCGAEVADGLSVSLVDSKGALRLYNSSAGVINSTPTDSVAWSSSSNGDIHSVASDSPQPVYYRYQSSASPLTFTWQKAIFDTNSACQLDVVVSSTNTPVSTTSLVRATSQPPARIITLSSPGSSSGFIPASKLACPLLLLRLSPVPLSRNAVKALGLRLVPAGKLYLCLVVRPVCSIKPDRSKPTLLGL